ncbi:MAG: TIGR03545 family protein [Colwellia sp.]|nr:TIGR03545 family protein [Colwellia sp.]
MKRFIRWQGFIGFFSIIILLMAFIFLFADSLVKAGIEKSGEWYLGAEVNVEDIELNFSPLSLTVIGFQATDPEKPSHNMVSFTEATAGIELWQYLLGKIHISDLTIAQLELGNKRQSEGAVYFTSDSKGNDETTDTTMGLPSLDTSLPSVDDLLKDSNLETVKQAQLLQGTYKSEQEKLVAIQDSLPSKEKLAGYKKQVMALTNIKVKSLDDIEKVTKDFNELKKQFVADKKIVNSAKAQLQKSKDVLTAQIQRLKNAPQADWQSIEKKYSLQKIDAADLAHILFGEQAREYLGYAELAYEKLSPMLTGASATPKVDNTRDKGKFIYFSEQLPQPSVLIKNAYISVALAQGELVIEGKDLTHQHWINEQQSVVNVHSSNLQGKGEFALDMMFSLNEQQVIKINSNWQLDNLSVADVAIQKSSAFSLSLDSGLVSGKGKFELLAQQIKSVNDISINKADFAGKASSSLTKMFLDTITSTDNLALTISATGIVTSPELSISSPLDNQLKGAVQKLVSKKLASFKDQVNTGLNEKLASALGNSKSDGKALVNLENLINGADGSLTDLLNADITKGHKKQLEDKLKKKLGNLFGG